MSDLDLALGPPPEIFIPPLSPVAGAPPPAPGAFAEPAHEPAQSPPAAPPAPVPPPAAKPPAPPPAPRPAPPPAQRPPAATSAPQTYTVQPGDTLGAIASKNGTTVDAIVQANPQISDPDNIYLGQKIKLPGRTGGGGASTQPTQPQPQPQRPAPEQPKPSPATQTSVTEIFPLWIRPTASWKDGARYFGCPRSGGRMHGGVDLYAPFGSKIRAIADGVIIYEPYYFYDGTNALEVYHPGVGVVRYGEISSSKTVPARAGQAVKAGELIAYVGWLDSLGMSMIHFELYGESARGENLSGGGPFRRHPALRDPTPLIDRLYDKTFG
jgi:murein DD-endopeptidase MepM/ murein hydrolase activator NlpD